MRESVTSLSIFKLGARKGLKLSSWTQFYFINRIHFITYLAYNYREIFMEHNNELVDDEALICPLDKERTIKNFRRASKEVTDELSEEETPPK